MMRVSGGSPRGNQQSPLGSNPQSLQAPSLDKGAIDVEPNTSLIGSGSMYDKAKRQQIFLDVILGGVRKHEAQTGVGTPAAPEPEPELDNCEGLGDPSTQPKNFSTYIQGMLPCFEEEEGFRDRREFLRKAVKETLRIPD